MPKGHNSIPGFPHRHIAGQVSLEFLIVLGISLAIVTAIFIFAMMYTSDSLRVAQARDTVDKVARAADSVSALGAGSKMTVQVYMPKEVTLATVSGNSVRLRVVLGSGETDVFATTRTNLTGSMPSGFDLQQVTLTSGENGIVMVGTELLTCSPASISVSIPQGNSSSSAVLVTNVGLLNLTGFNATIGSIADIASAGTPPSSLAPGASGNVTVSFSVGAKPVGAYSGTLTVNASNSSQCSSRITVFVTSSGGADTQGPLVSGLASSPSNASNVTAITLSGTGSDVGRGGSNIAGCDASLDNSGVWNAMSPVDGSYSSPTESITYYVGFLSSGNHTLSARCTDSAGNIGPSSSINISVSGAGGGGDTQGPLVSNITISPAAPDSRSNITVTATGSDATTGNNPVTMCQLQLDSSGAWLNMTAASGYGYATVNVSYNLGNQSAGNHTAQLRCIDSLNNVGVINSLTFAVSAADLTGPIVTSITRVPASATTTTPITVYAIGNDSTTGGSNVSRCYLSLDAGAYNGMNLTSGSWNTTVAVNATYSLGTLSVGSHTISVFCADSKGNNGTAVNNSFTVQWGYTKNMLFITLVASPSSTESRWQTWINGHTSSESLNWSYDNATVAQVAAGSVNLTSYKVVVMADSQAVNAAFWGKMNNYTATAHYVVLLGASPQYGLYYMNAATANCSSENNHFAVPRNSHYVTTGYTIGTSYSIHTANNLQWYSTSFSGTNVASTSTSSTRGLIIDDTVEFVLTYSDTRPDSFNADGNTFATHVLDYALLNSG